MKKVYSNTLSLFFYDTADKKTSFAVWAKARARRTARPAKENFSLEEGGVFPASVAKRSFPPVTSEDSRRLGKRVSIWASRFDVGLALNTHSHEKTRARHSYEGYSVMVPVLESEAAR